MKKDFGWTLLIAVLIGFILGGAFWAPVTKRIMDKQFLKGVKDAQIYPTGGFDLTFSVNEDVVDLPGKEALTILIEQFVMDLAEAVSSYRMDNNIGHIKILGARLMGNKNEETRLKGMLSIRVSDRD